MYSRGSWDEFLHFNKPWTRDKVEGMIRRIDKGRIPITNEAIYEEGDGWYGMRAKAYDSGNPELLLDAIQLEEAIESIKDMAVKAATILSMHGWNEENIGSVIKDRGHRPGVKLVKTGVDAVIAYERTKRG